MPPRAVDAEARKAVRPAIHLAAHHARRRRRPPRNAATAADAAASAANAIVLAPTATAAAATTTTITAAAVTTITTAAGVSGRQLVSAGFVASVATEPQRGPRTPLARSAPVARRGAVRRSMPRRQHSGAARACGKSRG